jgi:ABC-type nitrate/sulfonate/bicarbonate transport system permease component
MGRSKFKDSTDTDEFHPFRFEKNKQENTETRVFPSGMTVVQSLWPPVVLSLALLLCWEGYVRLAHIDPFTLPAPSRIFSASLAASAAFSLHLQPTLSETALGFASSLVTGGIAAVLLDVTPLLQRALYPLLVASQAIPIVAIAPLFVLWFGFGLLPKVLVVMLVCFFPITVATYDGLQSTDPELVKLYRTFGAKTWSLFWRLRLPSALPSFFSGLRIAATYAVVGAIFSEYIGAFTGLGVFLQDAQHSFRTDLVFGVVIVTALLSIALFLAVHLVERLCIPWYFASGRGQGRK